MYMLGQSDVGHRLRVLETASNISGAGTARASSTTLIVRPAVAVSASRPLLSVPSARRASLGFTLQVGSREPPLSEITVTLSGVLHLTGTGGMTSAAVAREKEITVEVAGRAVRFSPRMMVHALTIVLRRSTTEVRITLGRGLIRANDKLVRRSGRRGLGQIHIPVAVLESGGLETRLIVSVPVR
jgi:hypothetical protein